MERITKVATLTNAEPALSRRYHIGLLYGQQVYRFRWIIVILWVLVLILSIPFALRVTGVLTNKEEPLTSSESSQVQRILQQKLHQSTLPILVVFHSDQVPVSAPAYQQEIERFLTKAHTLAQTSSITQGNVGKDGRTFYLLLSYKGATDPYAAYLANLHKAVSGKPAEAFITGSDAVGQDFSTIVSADVDRADSESLPIALIVLLIVFGTVGAALLPIGLAAFVLPIALAVIYAVAIRTPINILVLNIASIIGLGTSIDYSLFMIRRFREELTRQNSVSSAVAWTIATSGEAILFSGLTVMIGFLGLLVLGIQFMTTFGIGGAIVVAISILAAISLLPALLSILGPRINKLSLPFLSRHKMSPRAQSRPDNSQGFWHNWALFVMNRSVFIVLAASILLVVLSWPVLFLSIGTLSYTSLPADSVSRQGIEMFKTQYPSISENLIYVVAQTTDGTSPLTQKNLVSLSELTHWLTRQPHVTNVTSLINLPRTNTTPLNEQRLFTLYSSGQFQSVPALSQMVSSTTSKDVTLITVSSNATLDSADGKALIDDIRAGDKKEAAGFTVLVGGTQAMTLDFERFIYGNFPRAILFIVIVTYLLLMLIFRSVLLPLKAVLMNLLSVGVAYGVLVIIFQWGNLGQILGFSSTGFIDSTIPILLFGILFGLSMDYEVFLLSRIHEEWLQTHNNRWAVARGLEKTASVFTNAALLFIIVTGAFIFTRLISTKELGLGITVAILVDATIIRALLVPATMDLLGIWNWWFPRLFTSRKATLPADVPPSTDE